MRWCQLVLVVAALAGVHVGPVAAQDSAGWRVPFEGSESAPVVHDGTLYIGSFDGAVQAIDPKTGRLTWRFQTGVGLISGPEIIIAPGRRFEDALGAALKESGAGQGRRMVTASPVIDEGTVYIGAQDFSFHALDARTGQPRWSADLRQPIKRQALLAGGVVLVHGSHSGPARVRDAVFALDRADGRVLWSTLGRGQATYPAVSGGVVFYGRIADPDKPPAVVEAADLRTGQVLWTQPLRFALPEQVFVAPGLVLATSFIGDELELLALRADSGQLAWRYSAGPFRPSRPPELVIGQGQVHFVSPQGVHAVHLGTGQRAWLLEGTFSPFEMVLREALFVHGDSSSNDNQLYAVDTRAGKVIWTYKDKNLFYARAEPEAIYVSAGEALVALNASTGKLLWKFKTGGMFKSGPQVSAVPVVFGQHVIFPAETNLIWGRDPIPGQLFSIHKATGKPE